MADPLEVREDVAKATDGATNNRADSAKPEHYG